MLAIPARPESLGFVLFLERHIDVLAFGLLLLRLGRHALGLRLLVAFKLGNAALQVRIVEHGGRLGILPGFFSR